MLAALLTNLSGSSDSVPAKQRKHKRPYDELQRFASRTELLRQKEIATQMEAAVMRLRNIQQDVPELQRATEQIVQRYARSKVVPIRAGIEIPQHQSFIDYADMAQSPLVQHQLQKLLDWADEEDVLMLLLLS